MANIVRIIFLAIGAVIFAVHFDSPALMPGILFIGYGLIGLNETENRVRRK